MMNPLIIIFGQIKVWLNQLAVIIGRLKCQVILKTSCNDTVFSKSVQFLLAFRCRNILLMVISLSG